MPGFDASVLAERVSAVERHLARVAQKLPPYAHDFVPGSDASDAVVLHLWQAVQIVIDQAVACSVRLHLGTPSSYRDAFDRLVRAGFIDADLGERLARAAGFRNAIAHAYESLDLRLVYAAAQSGPADLRAFLAKLRDLT